uniref:Transposase (Putative), gypsy type n=1 Tax=Tanacetum cinerariifolium TaxID=118510 RepID=A0A6L2KU55_TANCI|nr:transposase (putative), gypsy type [Tanacetum cinerariifolium]
MGRDTIQLETAVSTISQEYLLEFTSEYGISEDVHPELPGPEERIVDFPKDMDLFNLISAPNPSKVKTGLRPRVAHDVPLLTATASRVIDMEDADVATESSEAPSAIEKSPLDFDNENPSPPIVEGKGTKDQAHEIVAPEIPPGNMPATGAASEVSLEEEVAAMKPRLSKKRCRRVNDRADANAPPKVLRKYYASSTRGGKSLPTMRLAAGSTFITPADTKGVSDPDPSFEIPTGNMATMEVQDTRSAKSAGSGKSTSSPSMVGSSKDHIVPPGYFSKLRHMPNVEFLSQYNKNLAQQVAIGSQLRMRFEQEVRLLKKARAQIARRDQRIQTQVTGEERIKAAFEEFKKYEDNRVEKHCAEMDACLDALSIDFDEELYPHMLTAIAGRRWVIGHGLRLAVMKCAESIELRQEFANVVSARIAKGMSECLVHGIEHGKAGRGLEVMEAYDPEANNKYLQAVKEEMLLEEAIAAKVSCAEKKKRFRVVCRTHGIGSAHHARSDGVPVSVPTVAP